MIGSPTSPPAFSWDDWYASVGGRSIHIAETDAILQNIRQYQHPIALTSQVYAQRRTAVKTTMPGLLQAMQHFLPKYHVHIWYHFSITCVYSNAPVT